MKRKHIILKCALLALLSAGAGGCNTTPLRESERALIPVEQAGQKTVETRIAALKKVMAPLKTRGVSVDLNAYAHHPMPGQEILKAVKKMGFNRICCRISSESELSETLQKLLVSAAAEKLPVELVLRQGDFKQRFRGNALVRALLPQFRQLPEMAEEIVRFNETLPANAKIAGVQVVFEPHRFTYANGASEIPGLLYLWSDATFGKGLDNDKLVELSIKQLEKMKANLKGIPLSVELPDFYPLWKKEGKLTRGSAKDFSAIGKVVIRCTGNLPSQLVNNSKTAMADAKEVTAVIPLADHTSVRSGALRRRDWNDLVRALGFFISSTRKANCSGVILRPLSELGYMLLEQD